MNPVFVVLVMIGAATVGGVVAWYAVRLYVFVGAVRRSVVKPTVVEVRPARSVPERRTA